MFKAHRGSDRRGDCVDARIKSTSVRFSFLLPPDKGAADPERALVPVAGLVPVTHVFGRSCRVKRREDVDGRVEPGQGDLECSDDSTNYRFR